MKNNFEKPSSENSNPEASKWNILFMKKKKNSDEQLDNDAENIHTTKPATISELYEEDDISSEKFTNYLQDYTDFNRALLSEKAPKYLQETYENLLKENPNFKVVKLVDTAALDQERLSEDSDYQKTPEGNGSFYPFLSDDIKNDNSPCPTIVFNFSESQGYDLSSVNYENKDNTESILKSRENALKELTDHIGIDYEINKANNELIATETLTHEFGHANDYLENYLIPELKKHDINDQNSSFSTACLDASTRFIVAKKQSEIHESSIKTREGKTIFPRFYQKQLGIKNKEDAARVRDYQYMHQPLEAHANKFAYNYIIKHFKDIFGYDNRNATIREQPIDMSDASLQLVKESTTDLLDTLNVESGDTVALVKRYLGDPKTAKITEILNHNFNTQPLVGTINIRQHANGTEDFFINLPEKFNANCDISSISSENADLSRIGIKHFIDDYELVPITERQKERILKGTDY